MQPSTPSAPFQHEQPVVGAKHRQPPALGEPGGLVPRRTPLGAGASAIGVTAVAVRNPLPRDASGWAARDRTQPRPPLPGRPLASGLPSAPRESRQWSAWPAGRRMAVRLRSQHGRHRMRDQEHCDITPRSTRDGYIGHRRGGRHRAVIEPLSWAGQRSACPKRSRPLAFAAATTGPWTRLERTFDDPSAQRSRHRDLRDGSLA
jgi:hypothetical protein